MADDPAKRTTCMATGTAVVRRRPSVLLMKLPLKTGGATLDLGLALSRTRREAAANWLRGLGAARVEIGEPHFADQAEMDQATRIRLAMAKHRPRMPGAEAPDEEPDRGVRVVLTATWDIGGLSADEALLLLDRLRFESAPPPPAEPAEGAEEPAAWVDPAQMIQQMMRQMTEPPAEDLAPQFLFVTRLGDDDLARATADALAAGRAAAERMARAAGLTVAGLASIHFSRSGAPDVRPDQLMERHRCAALLAGTSFEPREGDVVSNDPRAMDVGVSVSATYVLA
ncbi:MAG TPA: hypothetical protein VD866_19150 [Urbifossiella sp.]|nr:hypothetical protein [Urbifossiella sp.]